MVIEKDKRIANLEDNVAAVTEAPNITAYENLIRYSKGQEATLKEYKDAVERIRNMSMCDEGTFVMITEECDALKNLLKEPA